MDCSPLDLSMGFTTQEYWSGLPLPPLGDLHDPGIEPTSPALVGRFSEPPGKPIILYIVVYIYINLSLSIYPSSLFPLGNHKIVFYIGDSISVKSSMEFP